MNDKKEYNSLLDKLLKYDTDGVIINELVNQNFVDLIDITNFVINSNKFEYIYFIAKYVRSSDIEKLENKVIEMGNIEEIYTFLKGVNGISFDKFEDAIIEIKNSKYIYMFAKEIPGADIRKLEDAILKTEDGNYINSFVKNIIGSSDICKFGNKLIELEDAKNITDFAIYFKENINESFALRLSDALVKIGDCECLVKFIHFGPNCMKEKIIDRILEKGNASQIFSIVTMANEYNDLEKFTNAIINTKDPFCIYHFYSWNCFLFDDSLTNKLELSLKELGDERYLEYFSELKNNINIKKEEKVNDENNEEKRLKETDENNKVKVRGLKKYFKKK